METEQLMELRHAMERAEAEVRYFIRTFWQGYACFLGAALSVITGVVLGPLEVIPESMAWGVGIVGTIAFGVVSWGTLSFIYDSNVSDLTARRHEYERAQKKYYDALAAP